MIDIKTFSELSIANKEEILKHDKCACFYCVKIFPVSDIKEFHLEKRGYVKGAVTALCPYCGIDAIIPCNNDELTLDTLKSAKEYHFCVVQSGE